ncbi:MAG: hypothetical protein HKM02_11405 [Pseudomonadales bacterium]|nr:hypothetical protein [Pseudomonadales bacterium]
MTQLVKISPVASIGMEKGDTARIIETPPGRITVQRQDGQQVEWRPALQPNMTAFREQPRVLIEADTKSATANESLYYVAISRARDGVTLYTDDKAALPASMVREDGKSAALEVGTKQQEVEIER